VSDLATNELASTGIHAAPSELELAVLSLLRRIPGLGWITASRRVLVAFRGGSWAIGGFGASQLVRLASTLVLARMIAPQAFGLVALVTVYLSGLELLSDLGIGTDVIQHRRGDDPVFINTAFMIQGVRGTILWVVACGLAYPFAVFYKQPAVLVLAIVGSLSTLVRGFASSSMWTLTRHVQVKELTFLNTGSDFFGLVVSVIWAVFSPTAWALVAGRVATSLALLVASHAIAENPVTLDWDPNAAREIFAFGIGMFLSSSTYFLAGEAERLVVGKFVNLIELGCFSLALAISGAAGRAFQQLINQVFLPMMSRSFRENKEGAFRQYKKTRWLVLILSAGTALVFVFGGKWVVHVLLGAKYAEAGWMLQLLGVRTAVDLFSLFPSTMLFAMGTSRYAALANASKLVFLAVGLSVAFSRYGFHEAMWVLTLAPLASYLVTAVGLGRRCALVFRTELASFAGFVTITVAAMMLCGVVR
jgi:O-antigen/teichoic acid export membrane protein